MIFVTQAEKIMKLIMKYPEGTVLFNLDRSSKSSIEMDGEKIDVPKLDILPSTEDIEAFMSKQMSAKKVIRNLLKRVTKVRKGEIDELPITLFILMKLITDRNRKPYKVIGLILPETDNSKLQKLYIKAIKELMKLFGVKINTSLKPIKGELKGKRKKVKKAMSQWVAENVYLSEKGEKLYKSLKNEYLVEITSSSLESIIENGEKIKKGTINNIREIVIGAVSKGKKNRKTAKMYANFLSELEAAEEIIGKVPSAKKIKKISKKAAIIALRHLAVRRLGVELGSKEYNRSMSIVTKELGIEKEFADAMKKGAAENK